jgi:hypothetical protein
MNLSRIVLLMIVMFLFCCKEVKKSKQIISIATDEFPKLKLDSTLTDTIQISRLLMDKFKKTKDDSVQVVIECNQNIVLPEIKRTVKLIKNVMQKYKGDAHLSLYNKCLIEFKFPSLGHHTLNKITLTVDKDGNLWMNNNSVDIDAFCRENKDKPITIILKGNRGLSIDRILPFFDRFNQENFKVEIKVDM